MLNILSPELQGWHLFIPSDGHCKFFYIYIPLHDISSSHSGALLMSFLSFSTTPLYVPPRQPILAGILAASSSPTVQYTTNIHQQPTSISKSCLSAVSYLVLLADAWLYSAATLPSFTTVWLRVESKNQHKHLKIHSLAHSLTHSPSLSLNSALETKYMFCFKRRERGSGPISQCAFQLSL